MRRSDAGTRAVQQKSGLVNDSTGRRGTANSKKSTLCQRHTYLTVWSTRALLVQPLLDLAVQCTDFLECTPSLGSVCNPLLEPLCFDGYAIDLITARVQRILVDGTLAKSRASAGLCRDVLGGKVVWIREDLRVRRRVRRRGVNTNATDVCCRKGFAT